MKLLNVMCGIDFSHNSKQEIRPNQCGNWKWTPTHKWILPAIQTKKITER